MSTGQAGSESIESLRRGLAVLTAFEAGHPAMTVPGIVDATGLPRATVQSVLLTFEELGYVRAIGAGSAFVLTVRVMDLGVAPIGGRSLGDLALPHLQELSERLDESCSVAVLDGAEVMIVASVQVPRMVGLVEAVGTRFPARPTSSGLVLLAAAERERLDTNLGRVRAQGWAFSDGALGPGIRSLAAPLTGRPGHVLAAVATTVYDSRVCPEQYVHRHLSPLLDAASAISADLSRVAQLPVVSVGEQR